MCGGVVIGVALSGLFVESRRILFLAKAGGFLFDGGEVVHLCEVAGFEGVDGHGGEEQAEIDDGEREGSAGPAVAGFKSGADAEVGEGGAEGDGADEIDDADVTGHGEGDGGS